MSFITPILIAPSVYWACAEPHPNVMASVARVISRFIWFPPVGELASRHSGSHAEILVQLIEIGFELGIGKPVDDAAILHDVITIRNCRGEAKILLDEQNGEALLLEQADGLADLLDDNRSKALGWLIEQQKPGTGA